MTSNEQAEKQAEKEARDKRAADMAEREKVLNANRSGKGLRVFLGLTRGRNPQEIQYEAFDDAQPDTLPATTGEFLEMTKVTDDKVIVGYLIEGFNSAAYTAASDPVAEFVDPSWDVEVQKQFRIVVRNYSVGTGTSIEDSVALITPGFTKAQAKLAAEKAKVQPETVGA